MEEVFEALLKDRPNSSGVHCPDKGHCQALHLLEDSEFLVYKREGLSGLLMRDGTEVTAPLYSKIEPIDLRHIRLIIGEEESIFDLDTGQVIWPLSSVGKN